MTKPIRTVKREIRILGLDSCSPRRLLGAVVRGGLYLDGVILIPHQTRQNHQRIAQSIRQTRYYPELRAIMTHDPKNRLNPETIATHTRLPVIQVAKTKPVLEKGYKIFRTKHGELWVKTQLPDETVRTILSLTVTFGTLPEPARIAHLLAQTKIPHKPPVTG